MGCGNPPVQRVQGGANAFSVKGGIHTARGNCDRGSQVFYELRFLLLHSFKIERIPFILGGSLSDMTEAKMLIVHIPG